MLNRDKTSECLIFYVGEFGAKLQLSERERGEKNELNLGVNYISRHFTQKNQRAIRKTVLSTTPEITITELMNYEITVLREFFISLMLLIINMEKSSNIEA